MFTSHPSSSLRTSKHASTARIFSKPTVPESWACGKLGHMQKSGRVKRQMDSKTKCIRL